MIESFYKNGYNHRDWVRRKWIAFPNIDRSDSPDLHKAFNRVNTR
jgi:hypothetical protein